MGVTLVNLNEGERLAGLERIVDYGDVSDNGDEDSPDGAEGGNNPDL